MIDRRHMEGGQPLCAASLFSWRYFMANKLQENQLHLLRHLAQYLLLDYQTCLRILDRGRTGDRMALSYIFRPLTKHGYAKKHKDGSVYILAKGRALFPEVQPLVTLGGGTATARRVGEISRMAALMREHRFESVSGFDDSETDCFIPSTCWRQIRNGILSTTRFLGILLIGDHRLAVYDIENGKIDWQLRAERSLFHNKYREHDTAATGMLWMCDEDNRIEVAKNIIRQTMWQRRQLIGNDRANPREKPVRYSRAPIRIARQYERVYLTTPATLGLDIAAIGREDGVIEWFQKDSPGCGDPSCGDYEMAATEDALRCRVYCNPATDLLKYVFFFNTAKKHRQMLENPEIPNHYPLSYAIAVPERDLEIARMYQDIVEMEDAKIYVFNNQKNA